MTRSRLPPNWAFVLDAAVALAPRGKVLDYGCGQGEVVLAGAERGMDICGAELFYGGAHRLRDTVDQTGLLGTRVFEIKQGRTPFVDASFDLVFHNQVFEHVPDLDAVLSEIGRILKPSGTMLSLFPTREVLREGHCGVPLAHRFKPSSRLRYLWLLTARKLGLGYFHGDKSPEQWARDFAKWLEEWCYYRTQPEIMAAYRRAGFSFESYEREYATFRLRYTGRNWAVPVIKALPAVARVAIRKLAGIVVLSKRTPA